MKDTLLLIDANSLIHRAFHALPPFTARDGRPAGALYGLSSMVLKILKERKPKYVAVAFDRPEPTFREDDYKEYKATRPPVADTLISQLIESKKLLETFGFKTFDVPRYEADDVVASLANKFSRVPDLRVVILSGDRDVFQAVEEDKVVVESPVKGISNTAVYNRETVKEKFGVFPEELADYKGLVGDKSDNIPGVMGIGPKTAALLVGEYGNLENLYKKLDESGLVNKRLEEKLRDGREKALLSKKLSLLEENLPIEVDLSQLELKSLNKQAVIDYFEDLGFQSLVERLNKNYNE